MIKKLMNSIREYKRDSILAPVFVTLEVIMEVIIPWLMAELIDKGIDGGNMNFILKLGIMLAIACVVSLIFGALSGKYSASASSGFAKNLRKDMFYNIDVKYCYKTYNRYYECSKCVSDDYKNGGKMSVNACFFFDNGI